MPEMECPLCSDVRSIKYDWRDYLKHLSLFHAHHPDFKIPCRIDGCQRTYTNMRTYQNHVSSVHNWCKGMNSIQGNEEGSSNTTSIVSDPISFEERSDSGDCSDFNESAIYEGLDSTTGLSNKSQELVQNSAVFLLGLKEKYKLTQTAVQGVIEGVTNLTQQQISYLQSQVTITRNYIHVITI